MKYPSSDTLPEANLMSLSGMADGNLKGSKIGIRVWDSICSSAGLKTGAGPFACPPYRIQSEISEEEHNQRDDGRSHRDS
jgi:hypothetical protein